MVDSAPIHKPHIEHAGHRFTASFSDEAITFTCEDAAGERVWRAERAYERGGDQIYVWWIRGGGDRVRYHVEALHPRGASLTDARHYVMSPAGIIAEVKTGP